MIELESSEVWSGPPKPVVEFHTGGAAPAAAACALPPETFCSAKRTFNRPKWAADAPRGAVTAHANWIDGHDAKRAALARSGAWLAAGATPLLVPAR